MTGDPCGARKRQGEGTCALPAGWGTDHAGHGRCKHHGGASPSGRAAGRRAQAEAETRALAAELLADAAPVTNPLERLLRLGGETEAWLAAARTRVGELLDSDQLTVTSTLGEHLREQVRLYERALDRTTATLARIAQLKIDDRLTAIAERDMARIEAAYLQVWQAGRDGLTLDEARARAARHLRAVA